MLTEENKLNITVVGIGYVGMANAILLAQNNKVVALDISKERVKKIKSKISPIDDKDIQKYISKDNLFLKATTNKNKAYKHADYILVCTPTNYNSDTNQFDTSSIEEILSDTETINANATIVIKSTVPVGFSKSLKEKYNSREIVFSPEFLREGLALHDNLYPSRIIIGGKSDKAKKFAQLMQKGAIKENIETLFMSSTEAEAIKLFSNTFLAMRIAFFNELDSYSLANNLDTRSIIKGVCFDPRIGDFYNNPSFGYGGYCLPKDTKQLLANYKNVPHTLIKAIIDSNSTRKDFITESIIEKNPNVVGIHRMIMKSGSDNIRTSSIQGIIKRLKAKNIKIIIYEPLIKSKKYFDSDLVSNLKEFKKKSDLIIANRISNELNNVIEKVYTRDLTGEN